MRTFEKWDELANKSCMVFIEHALFDRQKYDCEVLQIINDEHRIGVVIKGKELFMHKHNVMNSIVHGNVCVVEDGMMTITIVNKL